MAAAAEEYDNISACLIQQELVRTDDPDDPLNWSWAKKHRVFFALIMGALLSDWGMTWGTTLFEAQALTWKVSVPAIANTISGGLFMQGVGGVLAVPMTQRYGRLPVLFWSQTLSCIVVIGAALSPSYAGFTLCRTLQGLFNTAPQVIGLSVIHDMFLFKDRARKINLWASAFFAGPSLGPFLSGLLVLKLSWRSIYGVLAGLHGFAVLVIIFCGEETLFDRPKAHVQETKDSQQPPPMALSHRRRHKLIRLMGQPPPPEFTRPTLLAAFSHSFQISILPQLFFPTAIFTLVDFMWAIGIVTSLTQFVKPAPYLFSDLSVALIYLAPLTGIILAQIWGHFLNDYLQHSYTRRFNAWKPEHRLWAIYPAAAMTISGLVLYGQTLQHRLLWVGLAFGWAMVAAGFLAATTVVESYALDCFPGHAAAASSWVNFWRTTGGFCVSYFQLKWVARAGAGATFGSQAGTVAVALLAIVATQVWGGSWRLRFIEPTAEN